jgi:GT2 family glycosyltransferase
MIPDPLVPFGRKLLAYARLRRNAAELRASGMVDAAWYRARNADLGRIGDPALHYLRRGAAEGRHPSAAFDGDAYRARYADVDMMDANPLLHYLRVGRAEGRICAPVCGNPTPRQRLEARMVLPAGILDDSIFDIGPEVARWPLVSVIIPGRDRAGMLARCVADVLGQTDYPRLEVIVVDNASRSWRARRLLGRLRRTERVRVLDFPGPFNWSAMNNTAARIARGEVLLLLNNDIRAPQSGWLRETVRLVVQPGVGMAGAKLLYPNGRVQHAGISLTRGAVAHHLYRHAGADDPGPGQLLARRRRVAAVTGACMAIRRDVFDAVGGLEETQLGVTNGDIDLCLRVRALGLSIGWTPHAVLQHHEAATRGLDLSAAQRARVLRERTYMVQRWGELAQTDPYLHPSLCIVGERLALAAPG